MATRSRIGVERDGIIKSIYCHYDGYLGGVGNYLLNYYNSQEKAEELISYGDMSCIGEVIGEKVDFDTFHDYGRQCLFYHRDRGEEFSITEISESELAEEQEYNYLFKDNMWYVSCWATRYKFAPLVDVTEE